MSILSTTALAFSMSADAFAAAVSKGVSITRPKIVDAMKIAIVFAGVETLTPVIGWLAGRAASGYIQNIDHWLAYTILSLIGLKMIRESMAEDRAEPKDKPHFGMLIMTAIGTSIDAMAVGVGLAFLNANIVVAALSIGSATFLMATLGIMIGHFIGLRGGRVAEAMGGICLILIGTTILFEHLGLLGF